MSSAFISLAPYIHRRPWLYKICKPIAEWYVNLSGYRKMGLKADDLIEEENEISQLALQRLSPKERYDRIFRIRRAVQLSIQHKLLPKEEWTKPEEDVPYLEPLIVQIQYEMKEKKALDTLIPAKKQR